MYYMQQPTMVAPMGNGLNDALRQPMRNILHTILSNAVQIGKIPAPMANAIMNHFDSQYHYISADFNAKHPQDRVTETEVMAYLGNQYIPYAASQVAGQMQMNNGMMMGANPMMGGGMMPNSYHGGFNTTPMANMSPVGGATINTGFAGPAIANMNPSQPMSPGMGAFADAPAPAPQPQPTQAPQQIASTSMPNNFNAPMSTTNELQIIEQVVLSHTEMEGQAPSQHTLGDLKHLSIDNMEEMAQMEITNSIPWNYEIDAIRDSLVTMKPRLETPRWIALIRWYELIGIKSSNEGLDAAMEVLQKCIKESQASYPLYKCFMEQMDTLPSILKEHFKSKTLEDFNKFMRRFTISSNDPAYPKFSNWEEVEELFVAVNKYPVLTNKFKFEYGGTQPFQVRILIALKTVLGSYFGSSKYFFNSEKDKSICAYAKGVHFYVGNYAARDYGIIPENFQELYSAQLKSHVVHAVMRLAVVTNFNQNPGDSTMATDKHCTNPAHYAMHRMFDRPALADWVVMDKKATEIIDRHAVGLTMDDRLVIL